MKILLKLQFLSILLISLACNYLDNSQDARGITRQDLVEIATKYNLQDSIREGYKGFYFYLPDASLSGMTRENAELKIANFRRVLDRMNDREKFQKKLPEIKNVEGFFALIEEVPERLQDRINAMGGKDQYESYKKEMLSKKWHIYLNDQGSITMIPAEKDDNTFPGKRLDR
jgi:hypothetical protein